MKKSVLMILVIALLSTYFPVTVLQAQALMEYHSYVVDEDENKTFFTLYDYDETLMIRIDDLKALTDYEVIQENDALVFSKSAKKVRMKDNQIVYGNHKDAIKIVDVQDETYVSLLPTIDYLDARIYFDTDHFVIKKGKASFIDTVKKMNEDLEQSYLLLSKYANVDQKVVNLWNIFASHKVDTLPDRIKESVFTTLLFDFELDKQKLSSLLHEADLAFYANTSKEERLEHFKKLYNDRIDPYIEEDHLEDGVEKGLFCYEYLQRYYRKNANYAKNAIDLLYGKKSKESHMMNDLIHTLDKHEKDQRVLETFLNDKIYEDEDKLVEFVLSESSLFSQGIKASSYFASKVNFYTANDLLLYKQMYLGLQAKVVEQFSRFHNKMKTDVLTKQEMQEYAYLVRMYYHLAISYSKFIELPLGNEEAKEIVNTRNHMYQFDAMIENDGFYFDDLSYQPSKVLYEDLKDGFVEPVNTNDIHLLDVYWTSDSLTPKYYKFLPNGKYDVYSGLFTQSYAYSGHYQLKGTKLYLDGVLLEFMNVFDARVDQNKISNVDPQSTPTLFYKNSYEKEADGSSAPAYLKKSVKQPEISSSSTNNFVYEYVKDDFICQCTKMSGFFNSSVTITFKNGYGNGDYQKEFKFKLKDENEVYEVKDEKTNTTYYIECIFEGDEVHLRIASDHELDTYLMPIKEGIVLHRVKEG